MLANARALRRATGIDGQTLICLINLTKHGRTFQGAFRKLDRVFGCAVILEEKQAPRLRVRDVASRATPGRDQVIKASMSPAREEQGHESLRF